MTASCLKCGSNQIDSKLKIQDINEEDYFLAVCANCGLHYLNPQPTSSQLAKAYDDSYYGEGEKKFLPWIEAVIDFLRSRNARSFSKKILPNAIVLDIGCGNGQFLQQLSQFGSYKLYGTEIEGGSAERAKQIDEIELKVGELDNQTFAENKFDAIILTHVFEHLPKPEETLDIIDRIAKRKAVLQIEIPNIASWQYKMFTSNWLHLDPPRHLHLYTPHQLIERLEKRGWKLKSKKYFSPQFSPFGFQQSFLNAIGIKRDLLYESMKGNSKYTENYSKLKLFFQYLFHYFTLPFFMLTDLFASIFNKGATVKMLFEKA